jgi:hypothetical protein
VTAAVAEVTAPPPPPPPERTRELEDKIVALTAELKAANDKCACGGITSSSAYCTGVSLGCIPSSR